jgi:hypothetical protein
VERFRPRRGSGLPGPAPFRDRHGVLLLRNSNRAVLDLLVLAATKLISNYTNHLAQTPNDSFMKGAEWTAPGKLKPAA